YIPTKKGEEILKKTEYLTSFIYSYKISLERAYYMVENYIDENCDDKVAEIYKFEFQRRYENGEFDFNDLYDFELNELIEHYTKKAKDYDNARKYSNIYLYFGLKGFLEKLMNDKYSYYDNNGDIDLNKIQHALNSMIDRRASDIYERLIYNENLSNNIIFELFKKDTQDYSDLEEQLIEKFINYVVSYVKKEGWINTLLEISKILENRYTIDKEEFKEDEYKSKYITTDIDYLKKLESNINVAIDSRSGEIHLILDDDSLDVLIKKSKK
ncbi:DNA-binding protein, partial [Staphylococcus aureus]|nr:DNA-binding protein [Staphylococcus aureus]